DQSQPKCQTSGGSPLVSDCVEALKQLDGGHSQCRQSTDLGSYCKTQAAFGTCKLDVCGEYGAKLQDGVHCGRYFQTMLNACQHGGLVGGYLEPDDCNINYGPLTAFKIYRLQFSHS
ncbi:hypothetical protein C8Q80DRAFT_1065714, partial [Daedaleopsis nitida]